MQPSPLRIEAIPGYSPAIGRLVCMLTYARSTTVAAVEGLTVEQLDHLHDADSNSIGALLAHIAAEERSFQVMTFEGRPLDHYLDELTSVRAVTLQGLAARDDEWLDRTVAAAPKINIHWAWFHAAEDEISHRGQIRWLRKRLPSLGSAPVPAQS